MVKQYQGKLQLIFGRSHHGLVVKKPTSMQEDIGSILGLKGSIIVVSCGVVCRLGLDLALLWLWCRLAAAVLT